MQKVLSEIFPAGHKLCSAFEWLLMYILRDLATCLMFTPHKLEDFNRMPCANTFNILRHGLCVPNTFLVVMKGQRVTFFSVNHCITQNRIIFYCPTPKQPGLLHCLLHLSNLLYTSFNVKNKTGQKKSQIRIGDGCELAWIVWNVETLAVARLHYVKEGRSRQGSYYELKGWKDSSSRSCNAGYRLIHPQNSIIHMENIFSIKKCKRSKSTRFLSKSIILHYYYYYIFYIQNWTSGLINVVAEISESTLLLFLFFLDTLGCSLPFL